MYWDYENIAIMYPMIIQHLKGFGSRTTQFNSACIGITERIDYCVIKLYLGKLILTRIEK